MKDTIANILNQCVYNKSLNDFDAIIKLIDLLQDKDTTYASMDIVDYNHNDSTISIHFRNKDYKLITVTFTSSEYIAIHLDCGCTYTFINDSYNIQYNDIRNILQAL